MTEALRLAGELERQGEPYAWATVVRVESPVSARPADHAVVARDGTLTGWVGGSCTQPIVVREALTAMAEGQPRLVRIRPPGRSEPVDPGVVTEVTMCASEGGLDVFIEPRRPAPTLAVVGSSPVTRTLARLAEVLGHRVVAVEDTAGERTVSVEALAAMDLEPRDAVVVATMNRYDEVALIAALQTRAGYVGLVASPRRAERVSASLREDGVAESTLARVKAPAGIDLGPSTQEEIALSILAELVARRHQPVGATAAADTAVDPVCGMSVAVTAETPSALYAGRTYHFCGAGCRRTFGSDPSAHVVADG